MPDLVEREEPGTGEVCPLNLLSKKDYTVAANPFSVTTGDFNGDGKLDLASGNVGSNTVSVLLNGACLP